MVTLRCTRKLRERLKQVHVLPISPSTTLLGDWYCNLVYFGRTQVILCVSEKSLLPILIPARDAPSFHTRLTDALTTILTIWGIHQDAIQFELNQMDEYQIAPTVNRSVLGSLNDFERMASFMLDQPIPPSFIDVSIKLAQTPCSPIGYKSPDVVTIQQFREYQLKK